ncbi:hypothetical protein AB5J62_33630 [Amycolatopsis sp. cg5]|uniref:hypothetical protein n=1 Tax=Amycolatopsis sp. cg5 TaxID=3238802 RepID=UPI003524C464
MTGKTRRSITFGRSDAHGVRVETVVCPAGTTVHVGRVRGRYCTARVAGTLFDQRVLITDIDPDI